MKSGDKSYSVNILSGHCSCPYFTKRNIPCKHMFAIFNLLPQQWSWHDLPMCLTNSAYMTLDTGMLLLKEEAMSGDLEGCSTEMQADLDLSTFVCGSDAKNELPSDVSTSEIHWMSQSNGESFQKIPKKQTLGHKLRSQQKKAHELLTKCKDVCYLTTHGSVLETVIQDAEKIYSRLIKSTGVNNTGECLPVFPVLAQVSVNKCKKRCKFQSKQRYDGPAQKRFKKKAEILQEAHEDTKGVVLENPSEELPLQEADEDVVILENPSGELPFQEADEDVVILENPSEELPLQETDEDVISENPSEELPLQEADEDVVILENPSEELPFQEADEDVVILENPSEELPLQEADEDVISENPSEELPLQEADEDVVILENPSEELPLQKTIEISENQEVFDGTKAVLNSSSETVLKVVMKERLSEKTLRNTIISNMHAGVHNDPLVTATRKSLGRPKQKIQRRERPRQLRQVSEEIMAITKQAKKVMRSLQCCDDAINKVQICGCLIRFSRTLCTTLHRKIFLPVILLKKLVTAQ